jgi:hypothetical protein
VTELQAEVLKLEAEMVRERAAKKEWEAAATALSGLQAEVKRLEGEVGKAEERQHMAEQQNSACSKEKTTLISELVEVRKSLAAKEEELASKENQIGQGRTKVKKLMGMLRTGEVEQKELREALKKAERALEDAAMAGVRRSQEGNRFHFVLASTGQAGSIPRSFLESEPESLLSKMYNGEWDFARDEQGRALINCHPERWAAILEHLATGAIPKERDPQLLAQARQWNLKRLEQGLEALAPGLTVMRHVDGRSCTAQCRFVSVMEQLGNNNVMKLSFCFPIDKWWSLDVGVYGVFLMAIAPPGTNSFPKVVVKVKGSLRVLLKDEVIERDFDYEYTDKQRSWGNTWSDWGYGYNELASEPLARAHDSLVVEVDICLLESQKP